MIRNPVGYIYKNDKLCLSPFDPSTKLRMVSLSNHKLRAGRWDAEDAVKI